jgi:hypothetical protein
VDVPPKLAARVRLLNTGQLNKNDPNDARSVAVAALRADAISHVQRLALRVGVPSRAGTRCEAHMRAADG